MKTGAAELFFFFQAEDGIRDLTVTGVQTCALPICTLASTGRVVLAGTAAATAARPSCSCSRVMVNFMLGDRKSTRLNSSHSQISYAVFCLKKKKQIHHYLLFLLSVDSQCHVIQYIT